MSLHALIRPLLYSLTSLGMLLDVDTMCGEVKRTNISVINHPMRFFFFCKKKSYKWRNSERVKKKGKMNFNKLITMLITNLLKPLLSKPETILI